MDMMFRRTIRTAILAPAALLPPLALLASVVIPALGGGASQAAASRAAMRVITIRASAAHFPAQIAAGMVALTLVNDAQAPASAGVARANPGATQAAIAAANAASNTPQGFIQLLHLLTFAGGPDSVPPGGKETAILDLRTPGSYVVDVSVGRTQDHVTPFTVRPGTGQTVELPAMALPITLKDMKFVGLPKTMAAGTITLKLANTGPSAHEISLTRLDPGKTEQDVANLFKGPQQGPNGPPRWAHDEGGLGMISAHQTAYLTVDLGARQLRRHLHHAGRPGRAAPGRAARCRRYAHRLHRALTTRA